MAYTGIAASNGWMENATGIFTLPSRLKKYQLTSKILANIFLVSINVKEHPPFLNIASVLVNRTLFPFWTEKTLKFSFLNDAKL